MKVTFFVYDLYKSGGVQRVNTIISNGIVDRVDKVRIISLFKSSDIPYFSLDKNIEVENLFENPFGIKKNFLRIARRITKIKFEKNERIVISGMGYVPLFVFLLRKKNIKKIAWEHQNFFFGKLFGLDWIGKRIAGMFFEQIIVLTQTDFQQYTNQKSLFLKAKITQIYNPVDASEIKKKQSFENKKIITCGSLSSQKGIDLLIECASRINSEFEWHVFGGGSEKDTVKYRKQIIENNLEKKVFLKGYNKNIYEEYNNYSIYVMTSRHEGFPMVLLEASAAGLPIVSFDCKLGPNEIIENGKNGYLIETFDIDQMSCKINYLLNDRKKMKDFSDESFKKSREFKLDNILKKWSDIIA